MLFLERITFAFAVGVLMMSVPNSGAAAPLRFAAAEMPKPDPCLPFITQTYEWLNENLPEGATFRYYSFRRWKKLCSSAKWTSCSPRPEWSDVSGLTAPGRYSQQ